MLLAISRYIFIEKANFLKIGGKNNLLKFFYMLT